MSLIPPLRIFVLGVATLFVACGKTDHKGAKKPAAPTANYTLGEVISFGRGGHSERYKRGGWGDTEKEFTWTNAHSAKLSFIVANADQPLRLKMRLAGFTNRPTLSYQPVEVLVNDESVAEWDVGDMADFIAVIPAEVANHEQLNVRLRIPEAASPKVLEAGNDPRLLGVCCFELSITRADLEEARAADQEYDAFDPRQSRLRDYAFGKVVNLGLGGGGQRYKVSGWYPPEPGFTWTGTEPAILEFTVPSSDRPMRVEMRLAGLTEPATLPAQLVEVYVNTRKVADWLVGPRGDFKAPIPAGAAKDGQLRIELRTPKATSPQHLGLGPDTRLLGVSCEALVIVQTDEDQAESLPSPTATKPPRR